MRVLRFLVLGLAVLLLTVPFGLDSCSIAPPTAIFATTQRPADEAMFLDGKLGVLQRSYRKPYLFAAYRILSGAPLTDSEETSLREIASPPRVNPSYGNEGYGWISTRKAITAVGPAPRIDVYKMVAHDGYQYSFRNCQEAAFDTASATYEELAQMWGRDDPKLFDWVRAQDQVFANCPGGPPQIPTELGPGADSAAAAYRRYQIAAATFYAGRFREASRMFLQIAHDGQNPWRGAGLYLSGRSLLRAAMFDADPAALNEAKEQLLAVVKDPELEEWHDRALGLLHYFQLRVEPKNRLLELDSELRAPKDDITQSLTDFFYLIDRQPWTPAEATEIEASGELAAWMLVMSPQPPPDAGIRAVERWRRGHSPAWLVAVLLGGPDTALPEMLEAANRTAVDSPEYESVMYYAISREIRSGRRQQARRLADQALRSELTVSSRNLILGLRTSVSANWKEFLRFGLRAPEPNMEESEREEISTDAAPLPTGALPVFDRDVIAVFNTAVPLSLWVDAARNPILPAYVQLRIAQAGWLRAVLLGRDAEAKTLIERVANLQPASTSPARAFMAAQDPSDTRFTAAYIVLRTPALRPVLPVPELNAANLGAPHDLATDPYGYRLRCWGYGGEPDPRSRDMLAFLTPAERAAAAAEWKRISAAQPWEATYLLRQTLDFARAHPDDPRVPEALHRAVIASHYRCGDAETGKYSKEAFLLLHRQYPRSPWTDQTKYWYK
jgi:hypothetical protein